MTIDEQPNAASERLSDRQYLMRINRLLDDGTDPTVLPFVRLFSVREIIAEWRAEQDYFGQGEAK